MKILKLMLLMAMVMICLPERLQGSEPNRKVSKDNAEYVNELRKKLQEADADREGEFKRLSKGGPASQALIANFYLPQTRLREVQADIRKFGIEKVAGPGFADADLEVTALTLILIGADGEGYLNGIRSTNDANQIENLGKKMKSFANDRAKLRDEKGKNLKVLYGTYGYEPQRRFQRTWEKEKAQIQRDLQGELRPEAEAEMKAAYEQFKAYADAVETVDKARKKLADKFGDCQSCKMGKK